MFNYLFDLIKLILFKIIYKVIRLKTNMKLKK